MDISDLVEIYRKTGDSDTAPSIRKAARIAGISFGAAKKMLITAGEIRPLMAQQVAEMRGQGFSTADIAERLGVSESCVNVYSQYIRGTYLGDKTENAVRIKEWRQRKRWSDGEG